MRRLAALLAVALLAGALGCGVRGAPRPPRPESSTPPPEEPCDAGCACRGK